MHVWKSVFFIKCVCDFGKRVGKNGVELLMNEVGFFDWVVGGDVIFVLQF